MAMSALSRCQEQVSRDLPQDKQCCWPGAFAVRGDKRAGISQVDFLDRAWRVANDKARELGWIV